MAEPAMNTAPVADARHGLPESFVDVAIGPTDTGSGDNKKLRPYDEKITLRFACGASALEQHGAVKVITDAGEAAANKFYDADPTTWQRELRRLWYRSFDPAAVAHPKQSHHATLRRAADHVVRSKHPGHSDKLYAETVDRLLAAPDKSPATMSEVYARAAKDLPNVARRERKGKSEETSTPTAPLALA